MAKFAQNSHQTTFSDESDFYTIDNESKTQKNKVETNTSLY